MKRFAAYLLLTLVLFTGAAAAQDESDRGFIAGLLEDALGGEGRIVRVEGFAGALRSTATVERITIADSEGIWLTIEDVAMTWRRTALLRGRIEVERMTASRIALPRLPKPVPGEVPPAAAPGFSLPNLPVSVNVADLTSDRIEIGAPVLGDAVDLTLSASARLEDQALNTALAARRIDGREGTVTLSVDFAQEEETLRIALNVSEEAGGIAARKLNVPGAPRVDLALAGNGPLSDFAATFALETDGEERLGGQMTITEPSDAPDARAFSVNLGGDVTALFAPQYRPFFGADVRLIADGVQASDGAFDLQSFELQAQSVDLRGSVALNADAWPVRFDVVGELQNPNGGPVILPTAGPETRIERARFLLRHDGTQSDEWSGVFELSAFEQNEFAFQTAALIVTGSIDAALGEVSALSADTQFALSGLALGDPGLESAVGTEISGSLRADYADMQPLSLNDLNVASSNYALTGEAVLRGLDAAFATDFSVELVSQDISFLSTLAQRELAGAVDVQIDGSADAGGAFDVRASGTARDVITGIPAADGLLNGRAELDITARRDSTGLTLERASIETPRARVGLDGVLTNDQGQMDLAVALTDLADAIPALPGPMTAAAQVTYRGDDPILLRGLSVDGPGFALTGEADVAAQSEMFQARYAVDLSSPDIAVLSELAQRPLRGAVNVTLAGTADTGGTFDARVTGQARDIDVGIPVANAILAGTIDLDVAANGTTEGITLQQANIRTPRARVDVDGTLRPDQGQLNLNARLNDLADIEPRIGGPVTASAEVSYDDAASIALRDLRVSGTDFVLTGLADVAPKGDLYGADFDLALTSADVSFLSTLIEQDLRGAVDFALTGQGDSGGAMSARLSGGARDLSVGIPAADAILAGRVDLLIDASRDAGRLVLNRADVRTPRASANANGTLSDAAAQFDIGLALDNVADIAPGIVGPLDVTGAVERIGDTWSVDADGTGPFASAFSADGNVAPAINLDYAVTVPNIGALLTNFSGPLALDGSIAETGAVMRTETNLRGPGGTQARLTGAITPDLDLRLNGQAPLGLVNTFIEPRSVLGAVSFDLRQSGTDLSRTRGQVTLSDGVFVSPAEGIVLENIGGSVGLADARAQIDVTGTPAAGGRFVVRGPVGLQGANLADILIQLQNFVLEEPNTFRTQLNGQVGITGPLQGGARIAGRIDVGETLISIASPAVGSFGTIPEIRHIGESAAMRTTRARAGLIKEDTASSGPRPSFPIDLLISAPSRIFVRGRGLDAELGGSLQIGGTTAALVSSGAIELIRGRFDILARRFALTEGRVTLVGDFDPFLNFIAETDTETGTASVILEGRASEPDVRFESSPTLPQEEVLAQIIFGRSIDSLSPFQALQLANAVASLAGRQGVALFNRLREGFALDDLDVTQDDEGNTNLRVGKYITDNIYTDIIIGNGDEAGVSLNIDITDSITARGTTTQGDGNSVGIFFERDY